MRAKSVLVIVGVFAAQGGFAADVLPRHATPPSATLFHSGGFAPEARGDTFVGAEATLRDNPLPSRIGDAAFYDDAPGCSFVQRDVFPFAHRFARLCR